MSQSTECMFNLLSVARKFMITSIINSINAFAAFFQTGKTTKAL